jgi:hypothetical protein
MSTGGHLRAVPPHGGCDLCAGRDHQSDAHRDIGAALRVLDHCLVRTWACAMAAPICPKHLIEALSAARRWMGVCRKLANEARRG